MPNDQFEIKMIYPTLTGTNVPKSWFIRDGFKNDDRVRLDENVSGNSVDGYRLDDNSKVRFTVCADSKDVDIGCDNNFANSTTRGYVYKPNDWMGTPNSGVEMTGYFKSSKAGPSDNPIIFKGPTGEHHSNTDCCSGSAHMIHIGGENENINNRIAMRYSKEMWHVHYITRSDYKIIPNETWSILDNQWRGYKYIIYKKTINNIKSIVLETWINPNADKQSWKKALVTIDTGGWGDAGGDCNGNDADILAFGNSRMMWRWDHRDGADHKFKWLSIRPINPNTDFATDDEDPVNPPTNVPTVTTFRKTLKLQRNINSLSTGCGVGGNQIFFEIPWTTNLIERKLVNHTDENYRTRIAQRAATASSAFYGSKPLEFLAELRKVGSPTGTISAKIWDSGNNVKYTAVNTITASTLPTSFDGILHSFDFSTNTYNMQVGDMIGVQYTASSDVDNCVSVQARDPGDGSSATCYRSYNENVGGWNANDESRDMVCQAWN